MKDDTQEAFLWNVLTAKINLDDTICQGMAVQPGNSNSWTIIKPDELSAAGRCRGTFRFTMDQPIP